MIHKIISDLYGSHSGSSYPEHKMLDADTSLSLSEPMWAESPDSDDILFTNIWNGSHKTFKICGNLSVNYLLELSAVNIVAVALFSASKMTLTFSQLPNLDTLTFSRLPNLDTLTFSWLPNLDTLTLSRLPVARAFQLFQLIWSWIKAEVEFWAMYLWSARQDLRYMKSFPIVIGSL